jgi:phage terminase large subunit-like protein
MSNTKIKSEGSSLEEKIETAKALRVYRMHNERYRYYEPSGVGEKFIEAFSSDDVFILFLSAANGVGKCIELSTPITMADGSVKSMGDIRPGDMVLGHTYDGSGIATPTKVVAVSRAGLKEVYQFNLKGGVSVRASKEHSFPVKLRSGKHGSVKKKTVEELLARRHKYVGGKIKLQQPRETQYTKREYPSIDPYVMGVLLGDGTFTKHGVKLTTSEPGIQERVRVYCNSIGLDLAQDGEKTNAFRVVRKKPFNGVSQNALLERIRAYGLNGKTAQYKHIPDEYLYGSVVVREKVLAGLIDTDGSKKEFSTKSPIMAEQFCTLVRSLGGFASKKERQMEFSGKTHTYYRIYWRLPRRLDLVRGYKQVEDAKKPMQCTDLFVESIEYVGEFECGDIQVEHPSHTYLSHGFVSTGNTALAVNMLANLMFEGENEWFQHGLFKKWPYLKRARLITESALVEPNMIRELKFWFPKGGYTTNKGGKHFESRWTTNTGWEFDIMTYDQDVMQFEGSTLGLAWFDEPPPDAILKATIARMRRGGVIIITATPISGSAHLYDLFAKGELEVEVVLREGEDPVKVTRRVYHQTADVESVCTTHGIRGHLEHEHIVQMVAEYPEDERQARVYGKFQHLVGLVYKKWDRGIHVIEPFVLNPRDFCVYHSLDPHPRNQDAGVWLAVDRQGTKYIVDELYINPEDTGQLAFFVKKKNDQYRMIEPFRCDPSAFIEDQHTGKSLATKLQEHGLTYIEASKTRVASDKRIADALMYQKVNDTMLRHPELYVFSNCVRFIFEVEHYRWQEWKGKTADDHNRKEAPVDKDDHEIECVGRILIQEPEFVPYVERAPRSSNSENTNFDPYV